MEIITALLFAALLLSLSFSVNRRLLGGALVLDPYRLALTASLVLLLALLAESLVNPLYAWWTGSKLWEYRVLPRHDANVSALGIIVWTAYGIHLYFTRQTLDRVLGGGWKRLYAKSLVIGLEAPFFFEVCGNLVFLAMLNQYYAYYLPDDVNHLTSVRVVPVYTLCVVCGLLVLAAAERLPRTPALPTALFAGGIAWLFAGSV